MYGDLLLMQYDSHFLTSLLTHKMSFIVVIPTLVVQVLMQGI